MHIEGRMNYIQYQAQRLKQAESVASSGGEVGVAGEGGAEAGMPGGGALLAVGVLSVAEAGGRVGPRGAA